MQELQLEPISDDVLVLVHFMGTAVAFLSFGFLVAAWLRPSKPNAEKLTPYESGEDAVGSAWNAFSFRYYSLALLFLLFEVEVLFLFPWAIVFDAVPDAYLPSEWLWICIAEGLMFVCILVLGLVYAWSHGHLDWVKPNPVQEHISGPFDPEVYAAFNKKYS